MYFNKQNNFFHGIMFHHFHDNKTYLQGQGSISKEDFVNLINFIGRKNILNANEFFIRFKEKKISEKDVCLTFDDSLKCQYDIAVPILDEFKIKAFFFVHTLFFTGDTDMLEIYRFFRLNFFRTVDEFYEEFFSIISNYKKIELSIFFDKKKKIIDYNKKKYPFYSYNDIKFRLLRDNFLDKAEYDQIMLKMFEEKNFDYKSIITNLYFNKEDLIKLDSNGHVIGLHSHSHPTKMEKLNFEEQFNEYKNNANIISKILHGKKIFSMSHPLSSYNHETAEILQKLGIEIGFRDSMKIDANMSKINNSIYELAREDHANVLRNMNK